MAYTIYRNIKILNIEIKQVTPANRTSDISGDKFGRDSYSVHVAELSNHKPSVTFDDFKPMIISGHTVSIAVNDNHQVVSVINHTNGKEGYLRQTNFFKDVLQAIIPILVIAGVCGGIAYKAFHTNSYHNGGYIALAIGVIIIGLIFRGMNNQYRESKKSFNELKNNRH